VPEIDEAETEVTRGRDTAVGLLKITSTFASTGASTARIPGKPSQPAVHFEASDSIVNLVESGYDLAIHNWTSLTDRRAT
jgi:hypothetical protein